MGKCIACKSEYANGAFCCINCGRICNYRNYFTSWRGVISGIFLLMLLLAAGLYWMVDYGWTLQWITQSQRFESIKTDDPVPIQSLLRYLRLDSGQGWNDGSPHIKGRRLHLLRDGVINKHVMVFVHGWSGDYVSTWGNIRTIIKDARFNSTYDFVFWGYPTGFKTRIPKLPETADDLNRLLDEMDTRYQTVTLATHSKGGLVVMRALLNRYDAWPVLPAHRIHKIVMFAPPTVNLALYNIPKKLWPITQELREMENGTTQSEIDAIWGTVHAILDCPNDSGYRAHFLKTIIGRMSIIHAAEDNVVDWVNGVKTIFNPLLHADSVPEEILRYSIVPQMGHNNLVKMGKQDDFPLYHHFEELLWERVGRPSGGSSANRK